MKKLLWVPLLLLVAAGTSLDAGQYMTANCAGIEQSIKDATNSDCAGGCSDWQWRYNYSVNYSTYMTPACYSYQ
jgi:hypothetical protein